jgi:quercetin dioxygenase-like cupin family protein
MASDYEDVAHAVGQTSGSPQRPGHQLARPVLDFDLESELARLQAEESWRHGTRNAKTLVKEPDFRIVLVALKRGARIETHRAPGRLSIQTVIGRLRVGVGDQTVDLPARRILALDPNVAHEVAASEDEDSAFLLTVAWPAGGSEEPTKREAKG